MQDKSQVLVWVDLEMTGLDPQTCVIVQMAIILTNTQLQELAPPLELTIWQPEEALNRMSPYVRQMHERSGLLEKIRKSEICVEEAEQEAMRLLSGYAVYRTARLCGNSVYQDRRFLMRYMPQFEAYLHYRQLDISTVKELGLWWYNSKYSKKDQGQHTALFDIRQSLDELRFYRQEIFRK